MTNSAPSFPAFSRHSARRSARQTYSILNQRCCKTWRRGCSQPSPTASSRWQNTTDWTSRELGVVVHAEAVRAHPFTDGNGRATRLHADLVFIAAQDPPQYQYDWDVDKRRYIELLRDFDRHRGVTELAALIGIRPIEE